MSGYNDRWGGAKHVDHYCECWSPRAHCWLCCNKESCELCAEEEAEDKAEYVHFYESFCLRSHFEAWQRRTSVGVGAIVRCEAAMLIHEIKFWHAKYDNPSRGAVSQVYPMVPELLRKAFDKYCHANVPDEIVFKIIAKMEVDLWNRRALRFNENQAELAQKRALLAKNRFRFDFKRMERIMRQIDILEKKLTSNYDLSYYMYEFLVSK